ncbi:MAG TPA: cytochrome P450 [Ktedonobacteraceae bacterium]
MATQATFPPGPKGLPVIGNLLPFQNEPLNFIRSVQRRYGNLVSVKILNGYAICGFGPEHVRYCLTEHHRSFHTTQSQEGSDLRGLLGEGLLTSEGDAHRQQRRLVQPAFHRQRIEQYADTMVNYTLETLEGWQAGLEVDMVRQMQQLTLRIILKTMFNVESREQVVPLSQAFNMLAGQGSRKIPWLRSFLASLTGRPTKEQETRFRTASTQLDAFVYTLIQQRRAEEQDQGDILSMLIEAQDENTSLSDQQIRDQVMTLMAAGHETVQNSLCWTLYLLAQHPTVQEKLLAELHTVLHGRAPTAQDLSQLPYLDWVVSESWRVYPPAWRLGRRAIEPIELDGYHFRAGTIILLHQWVTHQLPEIWGDPENFRPERWDPRQQQKLPQGAYFPFGGGPRMCIGMPFAQIEARLLLATILQHYNPRLAPNHQVVPRPLVTLRPYGLRMILQPVG